MVIYGQKVITVWIYSPSEDDTLMKDQFLEKLNNIIQKNS
jgi:hypothetical protein